MFVSSSNLFVKRSDKIVNLIARFKKWFFPSYFERKSEKGFLWMVLMCYKFLTASPKCICLKKINIFFKFQIREAKVPIMFLNRF